MGVRVVVARLGKMKLMPIRSCGPECRLRLSWSLAVSGCLLLASSAYADTHYVNVSNTVPVHPYTTWATAATVIQDAVDVAEDGDTVLVEDGTYLTGGRAMYSSMTNRVAVGNRVTLESVNGPASTFITGVGPNGDDAVRCVYLAEDAELRGFTLINGHTLTSGDIHRARSGGAMWCVSTQALVSNCWITGNSAHGYGGGAYHGTLVGCVVSSNSATYGGGSIWSELSRVTMQNNRAEYTGGAAYGGVLVNCFLHANAAKWGGGAGYATLRSCTVTANSASSNGGGLYGGTNWNSIIYYNASRSGGPNAYVAEGNYSCTVPLPTTGTGSVTNEPGLLFPGSSCAHLAQGAFCIDRGTNEEWMSSSVDIDGDPRLGGRVDIGCDEFCAGSMTGQITVTIQAASIPAFTDSVVTLTADIAGRVSGYEWRLHDGQRLANVWHVNQSYSSTGSYEVSLSASNNESSVCSTSVIQVVDRPPTAYVSKVGDNVRPFSSWNTAARSIQDAVDAVQSEGLVLVSNGVYETGVVSCRGKNRLSVTRGVCVRGVSGASATVIRGQGPISDSLGIRCATVGDGSSLIGFTLTNGHTRVTVTPLPEGGTPDGGGVLCLSSNAVVKNCVISGNAAQGHGGGVSGGTVLNCVIRGNCAAFGGGGFQGEFRNCFIQSNRANSRGGGTSYSKLLNCSVSQNSAEEGGGADDCVVANSILYYNDARVSPNWHYVSEPVDISYSRMEPLPPGVGNSAGPPGIVGPRNPHLLPESPCIDSGLNQLWMSTAVDIDAEPRRIGTVDQGADEWWAGGLTDQLAVAVSADYGQVTVGFPVTLNADIEGRAYGYTWDMGDGCRHANIHQVTHSYPEPGAYDVVVTASNLAGHATGRLVVRVDEVRDFFVSTPGDDAAGGTNWATAKATIQAAVDTAVPGDRIRVGAGIYATGGRAGFPPGSGLTNRVGVDKPLWVRSECGSGATVISGTGPNGFSAVRCVYLADGAVLEGFTLTNGHTWTEGSEIDEQSGGGVWAASTRSVIRNCVIAGNGAHESGGGAYGGSLEDCLISSNIGRAEGGGACYCTLSRCYLSENTSTFGGGAARSDLSNCFLTRNSAKDMVFDIFSIGLEAGGGGASSCVMRNCTAVGNRAMGHQVEGGGILWGQSSNCIAYYNEAPFGANWAPQSKLSLIGISYTCTTPLPPGPGNITSPPGIVGLSNPHLLPDSSCIDAGDSRSPIPVSLDIDGEARTGGAIDMGADEWCSSGLTDVLSVAVSAPYTRIAAGFPLTMTVDITGRPYGYRWDTGDGASFINKFRVTHEYEEPGMHEAAVYVSNLTCSTFGSVTILVAKACELFVSPEGNDTWPGTNWATAKAGIQAAVDEASPGDWIRVTNGLYRTGGRAGYPVGSGLTNRVAIDKPVCVESENGPAYTIVCGSGPEGPSAVRCVYLANGATLRGVTLAGGCADTDDLERLSTDGSGGGAWAESTNASLVDCVIVSNNAHAYGGGVYRATVLSSLISSNRAGYGGGAYQCSARDSVIVSNTAGERGGGVYQGEATRVRFTANVAGNEGGGAFGASVTACALNDNKAEWHGGGVASCFVNRSVLRGNAALTQTGGAAMESTLYNCLMTYNTAARWGGAASVCSLFNCTIADNEAGERFGGAYVPRMTVLNSILFGNRAPSDSNWGGGDSTSYLRNCCTVPMPQRSGSITNQPAFVDAAAGDFRIGPLSPCINAGVNDTWMNEGVDLSGMPRIFAGTVDMGACEFTMNTHADCLLRGAYAMAGTMRSVLADTCRLATHAPYSADVTTAPVVPTNTTDWLLLQLCRTNDMTPVASESCFLRSDGKVVNAEGGEDIRLECSPGHYYIVAKHRNHLTAMSAQPVACTNEIVTYDFTTGPDKYFGGTNACVQLSSNLWGMIAGDADGDGRITWVDRIIVSNQLGMTGYLQGDLNLDGKVDGND